MQITSFLLGPRALIVAVMVLAGVAAAQTNIPTWAGSFVFTDPSTGQTTTYPYSMVGTNPALGAVKTKIPVVIVPIKIKFLDGTRLNPNVVDCGDTDTPLNRTLNSPLFQTVDFVTGGTDLGVTQYNDAVQRASFWSTVSQLPDYHVLLKQPFVEPMQTLTIPQPPPGQPPLGSTIQGICDPWGFVDFDLFDSYVQSLLSALQIPTTSLPIFLAYNTDFTFSGGADLGYHSVTSSQQTYIVTSFFDPYRFGPNQADVSNLSHEIGEWMADPFIGNLTPAWGNGGACRILLEPGDPPGLGASAVFLNGFTYHLQELVFLSWFARQNPSTAVNQWYSFNNSLTSAPPICR